MQKLYYDFLHAQSVLYSNISIEGVACTKSDVAALHPQQLTEHHALLKGQRSKKACPDFHENKGCVLNMLYYITLPSSSSGLT